MNYSIPDIAEHLEITEYTARKLIKRFDLENTGFFIQIRNNINVLYYPEETFQKLKAKIDSDRDILDGIQDRRNKWEEKRALNNAAEIAEAEQLHPLVTDKRCLNFNWWPDIVPDCFKELSV